MPTEWFIGIFVFIIILIAVLRARKELHPTPHPQSPQERYTEPNSLPTDEDAILHQLSMGNKINAIKLYRVQTGVGLKEAKQAVEAMQLERQHTLLSEAAETYQGDDAIRHMLMAGNKINAIKLYRQRTGAGLKEAKNVIDRMALELKVSIPERSSPTERGPVNPDELQRLILAGQKIQAIKYYREATGVGLKEAKNVIDGMAPGLNVSLLDSSSQTEVGQVNPDELQRLILAGQKIQAIKYYREATGVGLKEAKDAVDYLASQMQQNI